MFCRVRTEGSGKDPLFQSRDLLPMLRDLFQRLTQSLEEALGIRELSCKKPGDLFDGTLLIETCCIDVEEAVAESPDVPLDRFRPASPEDLAQLGIQAVRILEFLEVEEHLGPVAIQGDEQTSLSRPLT